MPGLYDGNGQFSISGPPSWLGTGPNDSGPLGRYGQRDFDGPYASQGPPPPAGPAIVTPPPPPPAGLTPPGGTSDPQQDDLGRLADILRDSLAGGGAVSLPDPGTSLAIPQQVTSGGQLSVLLVIAGVAVIGYLLYRKYAKKQEEG